MKYLLSCLVAGILLGTPSAAAQDELPVEVSVDYAAFAYSDEASLLEVYLSFAPTSLLFERDGDVFQARLPVNLRVVDRAPADQPARSAEVVWQEPLELQFALADTSTLEPGQRFVHQVRALVPPGQYSLIVDIPEDSVALRDRAMEIRRGILVTDYAGIEEPMLSDVQLASSVRQNVEEGEPFFKHGLAVRPNVSKLYGSGLDRLYYYVESYRTGALSGPDEEYSLRAYISRGDGQQAVAGLEHTFHRVTRTPDVILGTFDVSSLPSGTYYLRLALLDAEEAPVIEQAKQFVVFNPDVPHRPRAEGTDEAFAASLYADMTEEEVDRELEMIRFIATEDEKRRIRRIEPLEGKRRFLMSFWDIRDAQPLTDVNENRQDFLSSIEYVNTRYGTQIREGWETDRGRTLLKYGGPMEIERHLAGNSTVPYVIWHYDNIPGEGRSIFIFADREGFGEFQLLHSNVTGERTMPEWQQLVRQR